MRITTTLLATDFARLPVRLGVIWLISAISIVSSADAKTGEAIVATAGTLLEQAQVSYVYGGNKLGDGASCLQCNTCLETKAPEPSRRLVACSICSECSLDCSHFTELVFKMAGLQYPYLDTKLMIGLGAERLWASYFLQDLETSISEARPGDLLVYEGHVVILERLYPKKGKGELRGDIVHATGGKDIKLPGQGIQRERFVELRYYRGSLRRILRHRGLVEEKKIVPATDSGQKSFPRLRPVR